MNKKKRIISAMNLNKYHKTFQMSISLWMIQIQVVMIYL